VTPRPTPATVSHQDQAKAADVEAFELLNSAREQSGSVFNFEPPAAATEALQRGLGRLAQAHAEGELTCRHLNADFPEVTWWLVGAHPSRLLCRRCAPAEADRFTPPVWAGYRCDHCLDIVDHASEYRVLVPSTWDPALDATGHAGCTPPILALLWLCGPCNAQ